MKEKIRFNLTRLLGAGLIFGTLLTSMQCQKQKETVITVYSSSQDGDRL